MTIVLDGSSLSVEKLVAIARFGEKVELAPAALERIKVCRAMLEEKLAADETMYGTNTGIGEFSEKILNDEQVKEFQKYLIYNHAAGIGEPAPVEHVRAALAGRINVHAHGNSGCRPEITTDIGRDAEQGCHAGGLPERLGGSFRRPGADGAGGAAADGGRRSLLSGRTAARCRSDAAGGHPGAWINGTRWPGGHQRLQPADGHVGHSNLRYGTVP